MLRRENDEEFIQFKQHLEFIILLGQQDIPTGSWKSKDSEELFYHVTMSSELTPVHHALVKANMVRRNRIRHAAQHLEEERKANAATTKLSGTNQKPDTGDDMTIVAGTSGTNIIPHSHGGNSSIQRDHQPAAPTVIDQAVPRVEPFVKAPMTATEIDAMPFMSTKGAVNRKGKGTAITKITRISEQQDFPPCPAKLGTFLCPYCAQALSGDYTNDSQWRYGHNSFFCTGNSSASSFHVPPYQELTSEEEDMLSRISCHTHVYSRAASQLKTMSFLSRRRNGWRTCTTRTAKPPGCAASAQQDRMATTRSSLRAAWPGMSTLVTSTQAHSPHTNWIS